MPGIASYEHWRQSLTFRFDAYCRRARTSPQYHAALSTTLRNGSPAANRRALSNKT